MELFQKAKGEGLQIAVRWPDADFTASSRAKQFFFRAKIMICGGHAGKSHLKQLQCRAQQRKFSSVLQKYGKIYPDVRSVDCHCKKMNKKKAEKGQRREGKHKKRKQNAKVEEEIAPNDQDTNETDK